MGVCGDCGWLDRRYKKEYDAHTSGYRISYYCRSRQKYYDDDDGSWCVRFIDEHSEEAERRILSDEGRRIWRALRNHRPLPPPPDYKQRKCFVCTAALNSETESNLNLLKDFRDNCIERHKFGHFLIRRYDNIGPVLAEHIEGSFLLRTLTLLFFIKPSVFILKSKAIRLPLMNNLCEIPLWLIFAVGICLGEIYTFLTET
jgi:hypothetical protein